jgi:transglutaminase-like putative cysteine protease
LTIGQAAQQLRADTGQAGWDRVEAARALVGQRMFYSRRNSFDSADKAFERGYGYCMQHAYALAHLLDALGFEAQVVQAFQNRFADGKVTSHAWVRVTLDGETRDIDPLFWDTSAGKPAFTPLSPVTGISPLFKAFTWWGAPAVNAYRYYRTGKDL